MINKVNKQKIFRQKPANEIVLCTHPCVYFCINIRKNILMIKRLKSLYSCESPGGLSAKPTLPRVKYNKNLP